MPEPRPGKAANALLHVGGRVRIKGSRYFNMWTPKPGKFGAGISDPPDSTCARLKDPDSFDVNTCATV